MKSSKLAKLDFFVKSGLLFFILNVVFWYLYIFASSYAASIVLKPELEGGYITRQYEGRQLEFSRVMGKFAQFTFLFALFAHIYILKRFSGRFMSGDKITTNAKVLLAMASYFTVAFLTIFFGILFI